MTRPDGALVGDRGHSRLWCAIVGSVRVGWREQAQLDYREATTVAKTSDKTSARNRARQALAEKQRKRRERDERIEAAATRYFTAADAIAKARLDAGEAIKALIDEGEPRGEIAELLGISTRDIKTTLDTLGDDQQEQVASAQDTHDEAPTDNTGDRNVA